MCLCPIVLAGGMGPEILSDANQQMSPDALESISRPTDGVQVVNIRTQVISLVEITLPSLVTV